MKRHLSAEPGGVSLGYSQCFRRYVYGFHLGIRHLQCQRYGYAAAAGAYIEDIQALWEISFGEDKKMAKYAVADGFVFLASEDGKQGLLLYFYKDDKDEDNFDGIAVEEGQQLAFQGDAIVMTEKGEKGNMTTYFEDSEHEGFYQLFTVTEKDGKKTYTDEMEEPFDEKQALSFLEEVNKAKASPLSENLGEWNKL